MLNWGSARKRHHFPMHIQTSSWHDVLLTMILNLCTDNIFLISSDKKGSKEYFSYFSMKTCCGYSFKRLTKALLMNTHNIRFHGEIRKIFIGIPLLPKSYEYYDVEHRERILFLNKTVWIFFLFLHENICCGYPLEVPCWGASNDYPQHMFLWRNKILSWCLFLSRAIQLFCLFGECSELPQDAMDSYMYYFARGQRPRLMVH